MGSNTLSSGICLDQLFETKSNCFVMEYFQCFHELNSTCKHSAKYLNQGYSGKRNILRIFLLGRRSLGLLCMEQPNELVRRTARSSRYCNIGFESKPLTFLLLYLIRSSRYCNKGFVDHLTFTFLFLCIDK